MRIFLFLCLSIILTSLVSAGPIHDAAIAGDVKQVETLLAADPTLLNALGQDGCTPLWLAAENEQAAVVKLLLDKGANLTLASIREGYLPLHRACWNGNKEIIVLLLAKGADVNALSKMKNSPLHLAANFEHLEIVQLLIKKGAKVNAQDELGRTALLQAAQRKLDFDDTQINPVVKELLDSGADPNLPNKDGKYPLYLAANAEVVKMLIAHGADLTKQGSAALRGWLRNLDIAEVLVAKGADVNAADANGKTAIFFASDAAQVAWLKAKGARLDVQDNFHRTPAINAVIGRHAETLAILLKEGADVNAKDDKGYTALHFAAINDCPEAVTVLLNAKADVNAKTNTGETPLMSAAKSSGNVKADFFTTLIAAGADLKATDNEGSGILHYAMQGEGKNSAENMTMLLSKGLDINARDNKGQTPLHYVMQRFNGTEDALAQLLAKGADVNARDKDGVTPVLAALTRDMGQSVRLPFRKLPEGCPPAKNGRINIAWMVQQLIAKGADPNLTLNCGELVYDALLTNPSLPEAIRLVISTLKDVNGHYPRYTLLHLALEKNDTATCDILLARGADVNIREEANQETPLHRVCRNGNMPAVRWLLEHNADLNAKSKNGDTPLKLARVFNKTEIVTFLLAKGAKE